MKWIFSGVAVMVTALALCLWQPKRHDTTLVMPDIRPCVGPDKNGAGYCSDPPQASAHGKVREHQGTIQYTEPCRQISATEWECSTPATPAIQIALAEEIAREEGWYDDHGQLVRGPRFLHNPGNLVFAGQTRASKDESCCWTDGSKISNSPYAQFHTDEDGWAALHAKISKDWQHWEPGLGHGRVGCDGFPYGPEHNNEGCIAQSIAYYWPTPPSEKFAANVIARLKKRGLPE